MSSALERPKKKPLTTEDRGSRTYDPLTFCPPLLSFGNRVNNTFTGSKQWKQNSGIPEKRGLMKWGRESLPTLLAWNPQADWMPGPHTHLPAPRSHSQSPGLALIFFMALFTSTKFYYLCICVFHTCPTDWGRFYVIISHFHGLGQSLARVDP